MRGVCQKIISESNMARHRQSCKAERRTDVVETTIETNRFIGTRKRKEWEVLSQLSSQQPDQTRDHMFKYLTKAPQGA